MPIVPRAFARSLFAARGGEGERSLGDTPITCPPDRVPPPGAAPLEPLAEELCCFLQRKQRKCFNIQQSLIGEFQGRDN